MRRSRREVELLESRMSKDKYPVAEPLVSTRSIPSHSKQGRAEQRGCRRGREAGSPSVGGSGPANVRNVDYQLPYYVAWLSLQFTDNHTTEPDRLACFRPGGRGWLWPDTASLHHYLRPACSPGTGQEWRPWDGGESWLDTRTSQVSSSDAWWTYWRMLWLSIITSSISGRKHFI